MTEALAQQTVRIGHPLLGVLIPFLVFVVSFGVTWLLYKHFSYKR